MNTVIAGLPLLVDAIPVAHFAAAKIEGYYCSCLHVSIGV